MRATVPEHNNVNAASAINARMRKEVLERIVFIIRYVTLASTLVSSLLFGRHSYRCITQGCHYFNSRRLVTITATQKPSTQ